MLNAQALIETQRIDLIWVVFDSLRWDVLQAAHLPDFDAFHLDWQPRHSPASFTYAAHHAFFSGFLPTPIQQPDAVRLFAAQFEGSRSTHRNTFCFEQATLPEALRARGYATHCIGGVGFFNQKNALGCVLPNLFEQADWSPAFAVSSRDSTAHQARRACQIIQNTPPDQPLFLFINVSATHTPTHFYVAGAKPQQHDARTQQAALEYAHRHIAQVLQCQQQRGAALVILTSDHGDAFGEEGYHGHRLGHPSVWTVPYCESILSCTDIC